MRWRLANSGQSLIETAAFVPVLVLMMAYAVDFSYFFLVSSSLTSGSRVAAEYSVQGSASFSQSALPPPQISATLQNTVGNLALGDDQELSGSSTGTSLEVCTKELGTTGNVTNCGEYGAANSTVYTPQTDPEPGSFYLNRVDVTYTVKPPIPLTFFNVSFLPPFRFHRSVVMRAMD